MPVRRATLVAAAALTGVLGWQLGALFWLVATGPDVATGSALSTAAPAESSPPSDASRDKERMIARGLFGERPDDMRSAQDIPEDAPETQLDLTLRGVLSLGGGEGFAFIVTREGEETVYSPGEELPGDARLRRVHRDRILLSRRGRLETLRLERADPDSSDSAGRQQASAANATLERTQAGETARQLRTRLRQEPAEVMRMVRFEPHEENGELQGFRLQPRGPGNEEILRNLGLTPDDVVTAINGISLQDRSRLGAALEALRTAEQIQVQFLRDGDARSLSIPLASGG